MHPSKRIYIAVDGVAPRAKMQNQRERRHLSSKQGKEVKEFLEGDLDTRLEPASFKTNAISPGTEFMYLLIDKLKFFVERKLLEDPRWRGLEIIISGGDVPGEGEQKIMEWLRGWKQSPDFDINESHCIYSNDADLVFLGLSLHLPKVLIMREVREFPDEFVNSAARRHRTVQKIELLYINLLREYMELEFVKDSMRYNHKYDIERIIDDFIMISFFIGNDFLHQQYCMSARKGNYDDIIDVFKSTLPSLGGYLCENANICWPNFLVFLKNIESLQLRMMKSTHEEMNDAVFEFSRSKPQLFEEKVPASITLVPPSDELPPAEVINDMEDAPIIKKEGDEKEGDGIKEDAPIKKEEKKKDWKKGGNRGNRGKKWSHHNDRDIDKDQPRSHREDLKQISTGYEKRLQTSYTRLKEESVFIKEMLDAFESKEEAAITAKKKVYYKRFFNLEEKQDVERACMEYARGVQFVMKYYLEYCPSWSWYYPYPLTPLICDLIQTLDTHMNETVFTFEVGLPFEPFRQLAYILPRGSMGLLPRSIGDKLISDERCREYYPADVVDIDPLDSVHEYQWKPKLVHFDDDRMNEVYSEMDFTVLTDDERKRNSRGKDVVLRWDDKVEAHLIRSVHPGFPDFLSKSVTSHWERESKYPISIDLISSRVGEIEAGSGYPSLKIVPSVEGVLQEVKRRPSYKKMVLKIYSSCSALDKKETYGGFVFYDYPFRRVGYVGAVSDFNGVRNTGHFASPFVFDWILHEKEAEFAYDMNKEIEKDCLMDLYRDKGIDYDVEGMLDNFYSIERIGRVVKTSKASGGDLAFEFHPVAEVHPQALLLAFDEELYKKMKVQFKFAMKKEDVLSKGIEGVDLRSGDRIEVVEFDEHRPDSVKIKRVTKTRTDLLPIRDLMETEWLPVDATLCGELDLSPDQIMTLYIVMDSFQAKLDSRKSTSLHLGSIIDVGLRFISAVGTLLMNLEVVPDLVR